MGEIGVLPLSTHPLLRRVVADRRPDEMHFQSELGARSTPLLRDHHVFQIPIFPAAAYLDVALVAAEQLTGQRGTAITNAVFHDLLALSAEDARLLRVRVRRANRTTTRFDVESASASDAVPTWRRHADGVVEHEPLGSEGSFQSGVKSASIAGPLAAELSGKEFYERADRGPYQWGETHRVVRSIRRDAENVVYDLCMTEDSAAYDGGRRIHPTLLDGCLQVPAMEFLRGNNGDSVSVPSRIDRAAFGAASPQRISVYWRHPEATREQADASTVNLFLFDESGRHIASLEGIRFRPISREVFLSAMAARRPEQSTRRVDVDDAASDRRASSTELVMRLESAPASQRLSLLAAFIEQNVVELLKLKRPTAADLQRGFFSIGLDSLLAIELQFRLQKALDFSLPPSKGLNFETIEELSRYLLEDVLSLCEKARVGAV